MNRGADSILSVYSDARAEYTKQLCIFLVPAYFQFFLDLLERAKQDMAAEPKRVLWQFQTYLNDIHDWNMEKVSQEIHRIHTNSGCDYLEDLLTAVFIAHTKVLTAIRLGQHQKKVEINIPKVDHFLFKVLCETAKLLWGSSYLFRDGISSIEKQQNYRAIEGMLNEGILQAIRTLVPVKSILKDFVHSDGGASGTKGGAKEEEEDSDEEDNGVSVAAAPTPTVPAPSLAAPSLAAPAAAAAAAAPATLLSLSPSPTDPLPSLPALASFDVPLPLDELPSLPSLPSLPPPALPADVPPPTILLDKKQSVRFGQFDSVFHLDHPADSDMVYDPKEGDEEVEDEENGDGTPLEILDKEGTPLGDEDVDTLELEGPASGMGEEDYEVLV